jgi:hypothetical protein
VIGAPRFECQGCWLKCDAGNARSEPPNFPRLGYSEISTKDVVLAALYHVSILKYHAVHTQSSLFNTCCLGSPPLPNRLSPPVDSTSPISQKSFHPSTNLSFSIVFSLLQWPVPRYHLSIASKSVLFMLTSYSKPHASPPEARLLVNNLPARLPASLLPYDSLPLHCKTIADPFRPPEESRNPIVTVPVQSRSVKSVVTRNRPNCSFASSRNIIHIVNLTLVSNVLSEKSLKTSRPI